MKRRLVRYKVYLDRSRMYSGYIQFFMVIVVFLNSFSGKYHLKLLDKYPLLFTCVGFVLFIIISLVIGRLDYKFGFFSEENRRHSEANPVVTEILQKVNSLVVKMEKYESNNGERKGA